MSEISTAFLNRYFEARYLIYKHRYEATILQKLLFALGMAGLTGLAAQIRVPLPWSPVPITGQTFAVLTAGVLLGRWWGGISQFLYVVIGVAGIPWFAGWKGGIGILAGPTGGYLVGFILAAFFLGHFVDTYIRTRGFLPMLALMLFANFVLIHGFGLSQLWLWFSLVKGTELTISKLLWMGTIPFIPGDIFKAIIAALVAKGITPKESYNGEVDRGYKSISPKK